MKLPESITGFGFKPSEYGEELLRVIKRRLWTIPKCKVLDIKAPHQSSNYYSIDIEIVENYNPLQKLSILLNSQYKMCAVIDTDQSSWMDLKFIQAPKALISALQDLIHVFSLEELKLPINQIDLSELHESEIKQIKYWNSKTLGEIAFNGYD